MFALALVMAGCGKGIEVKPIGTRVDPAPPPSAAGPAGAERALPPSLPGGWRLSGGPADYTAASAAEALGDEAGRFRGLVSYAAAEYMNLGQRVISMEAFQMSSPEAAAAALAAGAPKDAKPLTGDDLDGGYAAGLRGEAHKGSLLVRVRWFEAQDIPLAEAAIDALRDALETGAAAGLSTPAAP